MVNIRLNFSLIKIHIIFECEKYIHMLYIQFFEYHIENVDNGG